MRVILRAGPFVGSGFDGGGLPAWLTEDRKVVLREGNGAFLENVSRYFRKLFGELVELQATRGGPLLLVQVEQSWTSANDGQAERYLREIGRIVRECGITVPLINANNLWSDSVGTIDTWRGDTDLLVNLRQLRTVQPDAPRIVTVFEPTMLRTWGQPRSGLPARTILRRLAEVLAAGAQPIVTPFHGGTNFGSLGGSLPGPAGGSVTTAAADGALLGEAGARGERYHHARRLVTFASQFASLFADLDPDYQPVALDPTEVDDDPPGRRASGGRRGAVISIVPLRGGGGRVVFVFADGGARATNLLLDSGVRLPIDLGGEPVGWFVLEVDLHGQGRLDYASLCPFALVDRSIVVLFGPARTRAVLSVNATPVEATVPTGAKPLVLEHKRITFVILNLHQIDATYHDESAVYVGIDGFDSLGHPVPAPGWPRAWSIRRGAGLEPLVFDRSSAAGGPRPRRTRTARTIALSGWNGASAATHATGESPRYASLPGPQTLAASGAPTGYGWYRVTIKVAATKKRRVHVPYAGQRVHLFLDGACVAVVGAGRGARPGPVDLSLGRGAHTITALVDNVGRQADGNDLGQPVGLYGHLFVLKTLPRSRPRRVRAEAVDPFRIRGFIMDASSARKSSVEQLAWSFTHQRKTPILVLVNGAAARGTFVLNDTLIAYFAGETGTGHLHLLLDPIETAAMRRGKNVLRFAPDAGQPDACDEMTRATSLHECAENLAAAGSWAFAKWEPPPAGQFEPVTAAAAARGKGTPRWWRCSFPAIGAGPALWFDTTGLSKGQASVNGHDLGRYFTATPDVRAVGPLVRLSIPESWLREKGPNELVVFDEHGLPPHRTRLVRRPDGDLD